MRRGILFLLLMCCIDARASLPTAGYISEYYYHSCGNADLSIPGAGRSELAAQKYLLQIVDNLNEGATTFAPDTPTDNIISIGYLNDSLAMLKDSRICCVGGYYRAPTDTCQTCGEWLLDTSDMCFDAGEYYDNGTCKSCGDGYICADGTSSRVNCGAGYWCADNVRHKCDNGIGQCPYPTHTSQPDTIGCDNTLVLASDAADACSAAGVYYDGAGCADCGDGYLCPVGVTGRIECGPGFWCADNVRTACADGTQRCPLRTHGSAPSILGCDYTMVFSL